MPRVDASMVSLAASLSFWKISSRGRRAATQSNVCQSIISVIDWRDLHLRCLRSTIVLLLVKKKENNLIKLPTRRRVTDTVTAAALLLVIIKSNTQ
jgi:hypothetical protein